MKKRRTPITRRKLLISMAQAGVGLGILGLLNIAAQSKWVDALLNPKPVGKWPDFHFKDISRKAGIAVTHKKMYLDPKFAPIMPMIASLGAAAAAADYNNDSFVDVFVTSSERNGLCHLFRNNGDGTFTDVAVHAGVADLNREGGVTDVVWGDFDNDGWPDLYVVRWSAPNLLFRNNRDGTFTDVTEASGTGDPGNGNAAIWVDYNGDGLLDLYIGNYYPYVDLWHLPRTDIMPDSFFNARNGGRNVLYRNNGDGTFTNVAPELGVDDPGWTQDVGACDLFNTGHMDLYLANDFGQDMLFKNNGDGTFTNTTTQALAKDTRHSMNVEIADLEGDGYPDIYVTNITKRGYLVEGNFLWHNNRDGTFTDKATELGVGYTGWGWAAKFVDLDNDGEMEIVVINGYISAGHEDYWFKLATVMSTPNLVFKDFRNYAPLGNDTWSGYEPKSLFVKQGTHYVDIAQEAGITELYDGRGLCIADYDNDGLPELFIANQGQPFVLYKNYPQQRKHWLGLRLVGKRRSNRDAIGARVTVTVGQRHWVKWVDPGNGFASQSDRRLLFGLGEATHIDSVEIRWPDGYREYTGNLPIDRYHTITEGDLTQRS